MMYDDGTERENWDAIDLFDIEGCPEWANYAGADIDGYAHWFEYKPVRDTALNWVVVVGRVKAIPGRFGTTYAPEDEWDDWQWILEERNKDNPNILLQPFTPEIFKIENRPSWAKYAFMSSGGMVFWAENKPTERTETGWVFPEGRRECLGDFNPKNWRHVMSLEFGKLPAPKIKKAQKLTQDVFTRPETPHYAQYAAVDKGGTAHYFRGEPVIDYPKFPIPPSIAEKYPYWTDPLAWDCGRIVIKGKFDDTDWKNSVIRRADYSTKSAQELTKAVFNHLDCPKWAAYAAVDADGSAYLYGSRPYLVPGKSVWSSMDSMYRRCGVFSASDWTNSLVKRDNNQEKEKIMYRDSKGRFAKKTTKETKFYNHRDSLGRFAKKNGNKCVCTPCGCLEDPKQKANRKPAKMTGEDYIAKGIDMLLEDMGVPEEAKAHNITITVTIDDHAFDLI